MIDLNAAVRTVEGVELAADDREPLVFHVLPPPPRVATSDGVPQVELLRFIRDGELTGGHLHLVAELAHPAARLARARTALAESLRAEEDALALRPCAVDAASAELLFVGREATPDGGVTAVVARPYGRTAAQSVAPFSAAFSVMLQPEGVRLVEAAFRSGGAPIALVYRLQVEGLAPGHRVVAHLDWGRIYDHFSVHVKEGAFLVMEDIQRITESLVEERAIRITAVEAAVPADGETPLDVTPALQWVQRDVIERFCEPVLPLSREPAHASLGTAGEIFGVGSAFVARKLTQIERATADVDLQQSRVVMRSLTVQAHLADLLGGAAADAHIADADPSHPFFERMTLDVTTSQPLADVHAGEVVLQFAYGTSDAAARLAPDAPSAHFETWANTAPDRTWRLQAELGLAGDSPFDPGTRVLLPVQGGQGRALTLDLERLLGLRRVVVHAPPDPRVAIASVTLSRRRAGEAPVDRDLLFPAGSPPQTAWFRDCRTDDRLEAVTEYLLADGRRIRVSPTRIDTALVMLPPPFPGVLTVQLIADDDWEGLEHVAVALQKSTDSPAVTRTFDRGGQVAAIALDMPDPTARGFRYRITRTWSTGAVDEDDWIETDVPVVAVGRVASTMLVVDVTPVGPELPQAGVRLIEVDLSYIDVAHQVRDIQKAVIRAAADRYHWEVPIKDPARRQYDYRVTVHRLSGSTSVGPWTTSTDRLLAVPVTSA